MTQTKRPRSAWLRGVFLPAILVGASLLAKIVNDNAGYLTKSSALMSIASGLAHTWDCA